MTEVTEPDPARPSVLFCKYLRAVIHSVSVLRLSQKKRAFVGARGAVGTLKLKTGQTFLLLRSDRKLGPSLSLERGWCLRGVAWVASVSLAGVNGRGPLWGAGRGCAPSASAICSVPQLPPLGFCASLSLKWT